MANSMIWKNRPFENIEAILEYNVSTEDLKAYERLYREQVEEGNVDANIKFCYAWCLVHSDMNNVRRAVPLLEDLFQKGNEQTKRDTLFYLALANVKLKEYYTAKKYIEAFLSIEPSNDQVKQLQSYVKKKLVKDGLTGMALTGAAAVAGGVTAVAVGGLVLTGIGVAIAQSIKGKEKSKKNDDK